MACNSMEVLLPVGGGQFRSVGWAQISCRTAEDWYVMVGAKRKNYVVADHLQSEAAAKDALREYLRAPYDPASA